VPICQLPQIPPTHLVVRHALQYNSRTDESTMCIGRSPSARPSRLIRLHIDGFISAAWLRIDCRHTHTHPFNVPLSGTTRVSRYQKGETNLDFTAARDSEWQWHQLDHIQVCTSLQIDNLASTPPRSFLQAGCPSCHPTNSVKALKATYRAQTMHGNSPPVLSSGGRKA